MTIHHLEFVSTCSQRLGEPQRDSPITCATLRNTLMMFTLNPVCENSVLNAIPILSPQLVKQNALNVMIKNVLALRSSPHASTARIAKTIHEMISNGVVMDM